MAINVLSIRDCVYVVMCGASTVISCNNAVQQRMKLISLVALNLLEVPLHHDEQRA